MKDSQEKNLNIMQRDKLLFHIIYQNIKNRTSLILIVFLLYGPKLRNNILFPFGTHINRENIHQSVAHYINSFSKMLISTTNHTNSTKEMDYLIYCYTQFPPSIRHATENTRMSILKMNKIFPRHYKILQQNQRLNLLDIDKHKHLNLEAEPNQ